MDEQPEHQDLSLVSTEDLVREIFDRYESVLLIREKSMKVPGNNETFFEYAGGCSAAIGLAERAKMRLFKIIEESNGNGA